LPTRWKPLIANRHVWHVLPLRRLIILNVHKPWDFGVLLDNFVHEAWGFGPLLVGLQQQVFVIFEVFFAKSQIKPEPT